MKAAALAGLTGVSGVAGGQTDGSDTTIELEGETTGWVGVSPDEIEGESNPTLSLIPGTDYAVEWVNADGAGHNFAIVDADGDEILASDVITGEGETQTVEFTATDEMTEYRCQPHPNSMAGAIDTGTGGDPNPGPGQSSPDLEKYAQPVPIPEVKEPDGKRRGADYYEVPITEFTQRLHPDLPATRLWGFDDSFPGPIIKARRNRRIAVHFDNSDLPDEHLFTVDERIGGTDPEDYPDYDGPVPEVRTVTHLHGLNIEPESDGQSRAWTSPDGVTGPGFAKSIQDVPNRQSRLSSVYHDHTLGITRLNVYAGLVGFYFIESQKEKQLNLPSGEYDIPLLLQDRTFNEDGSLYYPDSFVSEFAGDTAVVNGAVWPYLDVEPRRYRFRLVNGSNARAFGLRLENGMDTHAPLLYQIAPDQGFLESVVPIGPGGELDSLVLTPFERADVIVDFSEHAGETITVTNSAEFPYMGRNEGSDLEEIVQIRVAESDGNAVDDSDDPREVELPSTSGYAEAAAKEVRHMTLDMAVEDGMAVNLLNNTRGHDEDAVVKPQLGTTEIWELENNTGHTHPIHLHLVGFEVIGRGEDGTAPPDPNERGEKDVVRVDPNETVRIVTRFGDFAGRYPWHCHMLEHEDHDMMLPFEVVRGNSGGNGDGPGNGGGKSGNNGRRRGNGKGNNGGNGKGNNGGNGKRRGGGNRSDVADDRRSDVADERGSDRT
ncbi:multicopper oxidase domain-containing protein (plasmid) [Haloferacaceae archaeon DSL9]